MELDLRFGKVAHLGNDFPVNISEDVLSEVFIPISGLVQGDAEEDDNIGKAGCEFDSWSLEFALLSLYEEEESSLEELDIDEVTSEVAMIIGSSPLKDVGDVWHCFTRFLFSGLSLSPHRWDAISAIRTLRS